MNNIDEIIKYYRKELKNSSVAISYLKDTRKLTAETINYFKIGYAPSNPTCNIEYHDRIMLPIKNTLGEYVAFTGRTLSETNESKYKNSFESPDYQKGRILYGFSDSLSYIQETESVFLVEGQFDFLTLWQNGIKNVVAGSGTGFTPIHARLLSRYAQNVYLCFDADDAGKKATMKVQRLLQDTGLITSIGTFPAGEDPDSLVRKNGINAFLACFSK